MSGEVVPDWWQLCGNVLLDTLRNDLPVLGFGVITGFGSFPLRLGDRGGSRRDGSGRLDSRSSLDGGHRRDGGGRLGGGISLDGGRRLGRGCLDGSGSTGGCGDTNLGRMGGGGTVSGWSTSDGGRVDGSGGDGGGNRLWFCGMMDDGWSINAGRSRLTSGSTYNPVIIPSCH